MSLDVWSDANRQAIKTAYDAWHTDRPITRDSALIRMLICHLPLQFAQQIADLLAERSFQDAAGKHLKSLGRLFDGLNNDERTNTMHGPNQTALLFVTRWLDTLLIEKREKTH